MKPGKLYKIERLDPRAPSDGLEWVFVWDNPYGGNRVIDKLPVGKPYMFIRHEPGMICLVLGKEKYNEDTYCKILVGDQVCYMHHSLYNGDNFQVVRSEAA